MAHNAERDIDAETRNRAAELGFGIVDCGGGGNCVNLSLARTCGESPDLFRAEVVRIMLQNEDKYRRLGFFENDESWGMYCNNMATPGVFIEGASYYQAAADYLECPVFLLSHQKDFDSYFKVDGKAESTIIWLILMQSSTGNPHVALLQNTPPFKVAKGSSLKCRKAGQALTREISSIEYAREMMIDHLKNKDQKFVFGSSDTNSGNPSVSIIVSSEVERPRGVSVSTESTKPHPMGLILFEGGVLTEQEWGPTTEMTLDISEGSMRTYSLDAPKYALSGHCLNPPFGKSAIPVSGASASSGRLEYQDTSGPPNTQGSFSKGGVDLTPIQSIGNNFELEVEPAWPLELVKDTMAGKLRHYVLRETLIWVIIGLVLLCAGYIVAPTSTLEPLYGAVPYVYPVTSPTYVFVNTSSMEVPTQLPTATPTVRNRISPTCPIAALGTVLDFATVPEAWGRGYYDTTVIARGFKHGEIIPDARVITSYSSARTAKEYADSGDEPAVREFVGISSKPIKGGLTGYIKYFGMQQDSARCLVLDEAQQSTIYGLLIGNVCSRMLSYVCSRMLTSMWRRNMHCHAIYSETSPTYVPVNTPLGVTTQILTAITSTPNKILLTGSISSIETGLDFVTIPTTWGLEYYDTVSRVAGFKYEEMIQDTRRATNSITTRAAREYADVPTARDFAGSDSTQMIGNKSFVFQWDPGMGMA